MLMLLLVFQMVSAQSNLRGPASDHLLADTIPKAFEMKKATFEDCNNEVLKEKGDAKFNFLDQCIASASTKLKRGQDPRICFSTAALATTIADQAELVFRCRKVLGYDLCKVDTPSTDFRGRLDCIFKHKDTMDDADCEPDIQQIQKVMSLTKADLTLSENQESVLEKGYCQKKPANALPGSVKPAKPAQL